MTSPSPHYDVFALSWAVNNMELDVTITGSGTVANPFHVEASANRAGDPQTYELSAGVTRSGAAPSYTIDSITGWQ